MADQSLELDALYCKLMEEIKVRVASTERMMAPAPIIHGALIGEFCYLQLRMICELIGIGCLVAHGDIRAHTKLNKEYAAGRIFVELEKLNKDFYPHPGTLVRTADGNFNFTANEDEATFLTRPELLSLHARSGDILHRNLRKLITPKSGPKIDLGEIASALKKIVVLLRAHWMPLKDGKTHLICVLNPLGQNVSMARSHVD